MGTAADGAAEYTRFRNSLRLALERVTDYGDGSGLVQVSNRLVKAAIAGDPWAIQMIADRLDGKPKQSVDVTANVQVTPVLNITLSTAIQHVLADTSIVSLTDTHTVPLDALADTNTVSVDKPVDK